MYSRLMFFFAFVYLCFTVKCGFGLRAWLVQKLNPKEKNLRFHGQPHSCAVAQLLAQWSVNTSIIVRFHFPVNYFIQCFNSRKHKHRQTVIKQTNI